MKDNKDKKMVVTLVAFIACVVVIVFGFVISDKKEEYDDTKTYSMEKVVSSDGFDIDNANELNAGLVEVKSIKMEEVKSTIYDQALKYKGSNLLEYETRTDCLRNGMVLVYKGNELEGITGYRDEVLALLKNKSLADYLKEASDRGYFTSVDGEQLIYGYESQNGVKYKELYTDGPNKEKSYIYVVNYDADSDKLTLGMKNSGIKVKRVDTRLDLASLITELETIDEELMFNSMRQDMYIIVDNLNNRVIGYGTEVLREFKTSDYVPDMSGVEKGLYENTPNSEELNSLGVEFVRNKDGYVTDPLPNGYSWYTPESEGDNVKLVTSDNSYYASWVLNGDVRLEFDKEYTARRIETMLKDKEQKMVVAGKISKNGISVKLFTRDKAKYEDYKTKLAKYGTVIEIAKDEENGEYLLNINEELKLLHSK